MTPKPTPPDTAAQFGPARRLPDWLKVKTGKLALGSETRALLGRHGVNTVCANAKCPNIGECYSCGTATFLLLGDRCTRGCRFCAVRTDEPLPLDPTEPDRVAEAAAELRLSHVVLTSVTRDDLPDGGAAHFAATVRAVLRALPEATVETLIPDFGGDLAAVRAVVESGVTVLNHNLETVPRLYPIVRPGADYDRSLRVLAEARRAATLVLTKSGLMLGLGESREELLAVLEDLRSVGCDIVTLGQYLQPSARHLPVTRYVPPEEFDDLRDAGLAMGFAFVASGPFVRSSYRAHEAVGRCDSTSPNAT